MLELWVRKYQLTRPSVNAGLELLLLERNSSLFKMAMNATLEILTEVPLLTRRVSALLVKIRMMLRRSQLQEMLFAVEDGNFPSTRLMTKLTSVTETTDPVTSHSCATLDPKHL